MIRILAPKYICRPLIDSVWILKAESKFQIDPRNISKCSKREVFSVRLTDCYFWEGKGLEKITTLYDFSIFAVIHKFRAPCNILI